MTLRKGGNIGNWRGSPRSHSVDNSLGDRYGPAVRQTMEWINCPRVLGNCYAFTPNYQRSLSVTGDFSDIPLKITGSLVTVIKFLIKSCLLAMVLKSLIILRFCGEVVKSAVKTWIFYLPLETTGTNPS
jgi:hypothetical protein